MTPMLKGLAAVQNLSAPEGQEKIVLFMLCVWVITGFPRIAMSSVSSTLSKKETTTPHPAGLSPYTHTSGLILDATLIYFRFPSIWGLFLKKNNQWKRGWGTDFINTCSKIRHSVLCFKHLWNAYFYTFFRACLSLVRTWVPFVVLSLAER